MPLIWENGEAVEISDKKFGPIPTTMASGPVSISDRQFAQGLAAAGLITEAEAENWVDPGTVPGSAMALVAGLPEGDQFAARMLLIGATQFERSHPLTLVLAGAYGWSEGETEDFWRACAAL